MSFFVLVLLGLVQGLCEFLPVSSSGHLVLLSKLFGISDSLFVSIILHFATLLALLVVMRKEVFYLIRHPFSKEAMNIVIATIITCVMAIILMPIISTSFEGVMLPVAFLLSAILLILCERAGKSGGEMNRKRGMFVGFMQGLAILPGLSRSGTTIAAGRLVGASREESAKFSFLLSIPIIIASLIMEIGKVVILKEEIAVNWGGLVVAFIVAFVVGALTIRYMLRLTNKLNFKYFAFYLIALSVISAILLWL